MWSGEVWTCLTVQLCWGYCDSPPQRSDRRGLLRREQNVCFTWTPCFTWRAMKCPKTEICACYSLSTSTMPVWQACHRSHASWALYISGVFPERIIGLRAIRRKEGGKDGRLGLQHSQYEVTWVINGSLTPKTATIFSPYSSTWTLRLQNSQISAKFE